MSDTTKAELKPCPFCGGKEPEVERPGTSRQSSIIVCSDCGARVEANESTWNTGEQWNRRVNESALERELAEARAKHGEVLRVLHLERSVGQKCACGEIVRQRMSATRELRHAFGIGDYDGVDEGQRKAIEGMRKLRAEVEAAFRAGYHCNWLQDEGRYIFDPAMKPGDPDGAYAAWSRYQQERKA